MNKGTNTLYIIPDFLVSCEHEALPIVFRISYL